MVNFLTIVHPEDNQPRKYQPAKSGKQQPECNVKYLLRMSIKGFYCIRGCFENSCDILSLISER
ncbi:hypothetical protein [Enterobacter cloacae]|mgnify:CR=1|jgi:hypothetical protein|uniref:hypothetical protein n=1 Tax=Enterobacter cloacae TaxID=550 RepID=UPI000A488360|nr:hypothetical protein [Enterobacter cloacae]EKY1504511.1 hypothetical protein [Enterobacter cloacae]ELD6623297.1 hypothetical protein [Enterobacter cloacae]MCK6712155.1 hypothetical protein [Enterobacter cloacae]MDH0441232.1 hypothetical protein [Enterobacter cloacae]NBG13709.1 hypothetical protein [Enterobacter cloacae]